MTPTSSSTRPAAAPTAPTPARRAGRFARSVGRTVLVLVLAAAGVAVLVFATSVRATEALGSAELVGRLTRSSTYASGTGSFYWLMGTSRAQGFRITSECSVAYVVGPMLVLCGVLGTLRRLPPHRVVLAAGLGTAVLTLVNLLRVAMVALAVTSAPGERSMWLWHTVIGSLVSVVGVVAGFGLVLRVAFAGDRRAASSAAGPHPSAP